MRGQTTIQDLLNKSLTRLVHVGARFARSSATGINDVINRVFWPMVMAMYEQTQLFTEHDRNLRWVLMRLDEATKPQRITTLEHAGRQTAPKKLLMAH